MARDLEPAASMPSKSLFTCWNNRGASACRTGEGWAMAETARTTEKKKELQERTAATVCVEGSSAPIKGARFE